MPAPSESRTTPGQASPLSDKKPLIVGRQMRCPNCERLGNPLNPHEFRLLDRPKGYEDELNPIYKCMKTTGGCSHCFSPGDPWVMAAYLAGDLVPARKVNDSNGGKQDG